MFDWGALDKLIVERRAALGCSECVKLLASGEYERYDEHHPRPVYPKIKSVIRADKTRAVLQVIDVGFYVEYRTRTDGSQYPVLQFVWLPNDQNMHACYDLHDLRGNMRTRLEREGLTEWEADRDFMLDMGGGGHSSHAVSARMVQYIVDQLAPLWPVIPAPVAAA